jgi:hypothetical protein
MSFTTMYRMSTSFETPQRYFAYLLNWILVKNHNVLMAINRLLLQSGSLLKMPSYLRSPILASQLFQENSYIKTFFPRSFREQFLALSTSIALHLNLTTFSSTALIFILSNYFCTLVFRPPRNIKHFIL